MNRQRKDPVSALVRWRELQQSVASMRFEAAAGQAATALRERERSQDAERALMSARSAMLEAGALDLARVDMLERVQVEAARIGEVRENALESAERVRHDAQQAHLLARAKVDVGVKRMERNQRERTRIEERRVFEIVADMHAGNQEKCLG